MTETNGEKCATHIELDVYKGKIADGLKMAQEVIEQVDGRFVVPDGNGDIRVWTQKGYEQVKGVAKALACLDKTDMTMAEVFNLIHEETFRAEEKSVYQHACQEV